MHSNNDTMDPNYKPSDLSAFESFMNKKKKDYLTSHSDFYNTVHVTNWAEEYVSSVETDRNSYSHANKVQAEVIGELKRDLRTVRESQERQRQLNDKLASERDDFENVIKLISHALSVHHKEAQWDNAGLYAKLTEIVSRALSENPKSN